MKFAIENGLHGPANTHIIWLVEGRPCLKEKKESFFGTLTLPFLNGVTSGSSPDFSKFRELLLRSVYEVVRAYGKGI